MSIKHFIGIILFSTLVAPLFAASSSSEKSILAQAQIMLNQMTLEEKIGQKIMLDFRYWCDTNPANTPCTQNMTTVNANIQAVLSQNHIGGVILFANNQVTIPQITTLTDALQQPMHATHQWPLLIGTDQEGGIVARLPADVSVTFPGNMAVAAAYLGHPDVSFAAQVGHIFAIDLRAVGMNVDFAPDVDVNVNPLNPIINVRSFSDDPALVAQLGLAESIAIQQEKVAATLKHFPGHGDTATDSHTGLPVVNHTRAQAWKIDLYPFEHIIATNSPDIIMTAHIQYPALDDTQIYASKINSDIVVPATLSHHILYDILRKKLGYQGVIVTDALDMGAIVENFDPTDATIKAFQAGDDIALMPVSVTTPAEMANVPRLITQIKSAVLDGRLSMQDLDQSVLRILILKIKLGLFIPSPITLPERIRMAEKIFADPRQHAFEAQLSDQAVTLVQNNQQLLPLKVSSGARIHILTPWGEEAAGIAEEINQLQKAKKLPANLQITTAKNSKTTLAAEEQAIDTADIIIVGDIATQSAPLNPNLSTSIRAYASTANTLTLASSPEVYIGDSLHLTSLSTMLANHAVTSGITTLTDTQFAYQALLYATTKNKKTIFLSMLAPYDLPNYRDVADAMLVGYDYYGYLITNTNSNYRGPSMQAMTRIIFGITKSSAKLPVSIPDPNNFTHIIYQRGFGL